jgi:CheY-like chemotaxis protein
MRQSVHTAQGTEIASKDAKPTVLVAEDELVLRMLAIDFIEDAGFEVVEAENDDDAISILESRTDIRS